MKPFFKKKILLASQSPRRHQLIADSGFDLEIIKIDVEEDFHPELKAHEIPEFLAKKKSDAYFKELSDDSLLVTADTVVWVNGHVLNKPSSLIEAKEMLKTLSSNVHTVYTGVCVKSRTNTIVFSEATNVYFNSLSDEMIDYYLQNYSPLDKAGAYGIQEFIGYVGIQKIEGCYYNVMGFPVSRFIHEIQAMQ
jgi:septum formation protein